MSRRPTGAPARLPFTKDEVMDELRLVLFANAAQITVSLGDGELAEKYLGVDLSKQSMGSAQPLSLDELALIDLRRFGVAEQIERAFDYAFQVGDQAARLAFSDDDWNDLAIFKEGAARCGFGGEPSPLAQDESKLRHVLDMTLARKSLQYGGALTIRELALLGAMGETAVRTSLSAEGVRTEGKPVQVNSDDAESWLRRRRGFVPTLLESELVSASAPIAKEPFPTTFADTLAAMMSEKGIEPVALAKTAAVENDWLDALLDARPTNCDVEGLRRLGAALAADVPSFVARAVEAILRLDS